MADYADELRRRIDQFHRLIQSMNFRAHDVAHCSCFLILKESNDSDHNKSALNASRQRAAAVFDRQAVSDDFSDAFTSDNFDLPIEGWQGDPHQARFVQFSFERNWFCMDMPRQTLFRAEAEIILRSRPGFFYLRDRPQFTLYEEDVDGYDPFRKVYIYGDEESAAMDTAFVFFSVWKFPVDSRLYVSASSFGGKHSWESQRAVD